MNSANQGTSWPGPKKDTLDEKLAGLEKDYQAYKCQDNMYDYRQRLTALEEKLGVQCGKCKHYYPMNIHDCPFCRLTALETSLRDHKEMEEWWKSQLQEMDAYQVKNREVLRELILIFKHAIEVDEMGAFTFNELEGLLARLSEKVEVADRNPVGKPSPSLVGSARQTGAQTPHSSCKGCKYEDTQNCYGYRDRRCYTEPSPCVHEFRENACIKCGIAEITVHPERFKKESEPSPDPIKGCKTCKHNGDNYDCPPHANGNHPDNLTGLGCDFNTEYHAWAPMKPEPPLQDEDIDWKSFNEGQRIAREQFNKELTALLSKWENRVRARYIQVDKNDKTITYRADVIAMKDVKEGLEALKNTIK
jgi:hypothetical protein